MRKLLQIQAFSRFCSLPLLGILLLLAPAPMNRQDRTLRIVLLIFCNLLLTFDKTPRSNLLSTSERRTFVGEQMELLQGTLDLLILKTLALEPMHGWGISQRIQQV